MSKSRKTDYDNIVPAYEFHQLLANAAKRARAKKIEYSLDRDYVYNLVYQFCMSNIYSWTAKHPFKPSIDKIDSSRGYTHDNIKIIWLIENYCKNTFTEAQVIDFCKAKLKL